ncbi:MAG TPA: PilW family protein [Steroidobacteraceae bacterium]|nr:PilW family protein [Steroidobacteraceae bacterium]
MSPACRQRGVSLIELMVALVLGLFLIYGAVTIYTQSRASYRTNEAVARLQETARLALNVLESDLRMANYWGMNSRASFIANRAGPTSVSTPAPFTTYALVNTCGTHWAINVEEYLGGSNNSYGLTCAGTSPSGTADVIVVRRASGADPVELDPTRIYLQASRVQGTLFVPDASCLDPYDITCLPASYAPPASRSRELEVHAYYVSTQSALRPDVPALRRKRLANIVAGPAVIDEEIVPGVEDMQVRFGIDTNGDTNADSYVNPGAVGSASVVSATIWLRIRAEDREQGLVDSRTYNFGFPGASNFTPAGEQQKYRRVVVSRTIQLRNTRT